jgi:hypothetical protein
MTYKLYIRMGRSDPDAAMNKNENGSITSFIFDPGNTDYQKFKADLAACASLEDANGNPMTADQIAAFAATLP